MEATKVGGESWNIIPGLAFFLLSPNLCPFVNLEWKRLLQNLSGYSELKQSAGSGYSLQSEHTCRSVRLGGSVFFLSMLRFTYLWLISLHINLVETLWWSHYFYPLCVYLYFNVVVLLIWTKRGELPVVWICGLMMLDRQSECVNAKTGRTPSRHKKIMFALQLKVKTACYDDNPINLLLFLKDHPSLLLSQDFHFWAGRILFDGY